MISLKSFISLSTTCLPALPTDLSKLGKKNTLTRLLSWNYSSFRKKLLWVNTFKFQFEKRERDEATTGFYIQQQKKEYSLQGNLPAPHVS